MPRVQACFTGGLILLQKKYPKCEPVSLGELFFCRRITRRESWFTGGIILLQKKYPECKPVSLEELFFCRRNTPSVSLFHWGNYSSAEEIPRVRACFTGGIILMQKKYPECEPVSLRELFFCRRNTPSVNLLHWGNYSSAEEKPE